MESPRLERISPQLVAAHFSELSQFMLRYLEKAGNPLYSPQLLVADLKDAANNGYGFLPFRSKELAEGFVLYKLINRFDGNVVMLVNHLYTGGKERDLWDLGLKHLEQDAETWGIKIIQCETGFGRRWRAYAKRRLGPSGFKPQTVVYTKELV